MKRQIPWIGFISLVVVVVFIGLVVAGYGNRPSTAISSDQPYHQWQASQTGRDRDLLIAQYRVDSQPSVALQYQTPTPVSPDILQNALTLDALLTNIYQRVSPSVVNIEVVEQSQGIALDASGSGFVIDLQGHIATNSHVVRDADEIYVNFFDGYVAEATLIGTDDYSDLAVIKVDIDPIHLIPVELGDSSQIQIGQQVVAIGNPFGLLSSMTWGIVSATGRVLPSAGLLNSSQADPRFNNPSIIQVDATINPGNSGGPILNLNGQVIGIATAIRTETGSFQGVAFAVPVNTFKRVIPQLIEKGRADYTWLGISASSAFQVSQLAEPFNLPANAGILIQQVFADSPADAAGLRGATRNDVYRGIEIGVGGDIITAINGVSLETLDELLGYLVENTSPGDTVTVTIVRENETFEVPVVLQARPQ